MGSDDMIYSTGRGGAGNIGHGSDVRAEPTFAEEGSATPEITQQVYTTGRGGAGNMRTNNDPELTRKLQDVNDEGNLKVLVPSASNPMHGRKSTDPHGDSDTPLPQENPTFANASVGRGGYGNVMATRAAAEEEKKSFVDRVKGLFNKSSSSSSS